MKTFKVLLERLRSAEEVRQFYLSQGYSEAEADEAYLNRVDKEMALDRVLQDPTRSAEEHGQTVRMKRRLGDSTFLRGNKEQQRQAREASRRRRQPKPSYVKSKSPPLLTGRTINKQN